MLKLLKECKKYSVSTYAKVEISLNTCRNTLDFMCDLELFSKIRSHITLLYICTIKELHFMNIITETFDCL